MADLAIVDSQPLPAASSGGLSIVGSEPLPPPPAPPRFASAFWQQANPLNVAAGAIHTITHPGNALAAWGQQFEELKQRATDAWSRGDYAEAGAHALNLLFNVIPGIGKAGDDYVIEAGKSGMNSAEARSQLGTFLGSAVGMEEMKALPGAIKKAVPPVAKAAVSALPPRVSAAIQAGAPDIAAGAAKVAGGELLGKIPGVEWPARIAMDYPGLRQIMKGAGKGISAFKGAVAPEAAPAEDADLLQATYKNLGGKGKFSDADAGAQKVIRAVIAKANAPAPAPAASALPAEPAAAPPVPIPPSRQLTAGPRVFSMPPVSMEYDASGAIHRWQPTILDREPGSSEPLPGPPARAVPALDEVAQGYGFRSFGAVNDPTARTAIERIQSGLAEQFTKQPPAPAPTPTPSSAPAPAPAPAITPAPAPEPEALPPTPQAALRAPQPMPAAYAPAIRELMTQGQLEQYAAERGLNVEDAAQQVEGDFRVVTRGQLNRMLHGIGSGLGYDHGMLSDIATNTHGAGLGKISDEQMLGLINDLSNERASRDPLARKTPEAALEPPAREPAQGSDVGGLVAQVPVASLRVDPTRFQYKMNVGEGGAGDELRGVQTFDPESSGILSAWRDPANGQDYVVNGHNRYALAVRTGQPSLTVRYLDAATAQDARLKGALINIREGRGTAIDAAKVFRDSGLDQNALESQGISLKGAIAKQGLALANLDPKLFGQVVSGDLPVERAAAIGELARPEDQLALMDALKQRERMGVRLTNDQVGEMIRLTPPSISETQETLFGPQEIQRSALPQKAEVSDYVQKRLAQDRRLFTTVANRTAASRLGQAGNVIQAEGNAEIAQAASQEHALYQKLSTGAGPVNDALDRAARSIVQGEKTNIVKERAYGEIEAELKRQVQSLTGKGAVSAGGSQGPGVAGRIAPGSGRSAETGASLNPVLDTPAKIAAAKKLAEALGQGATTTIGDLMSPK